MVDNCFLKYIFIFVIIFLNVVVVHFCLMLGSNINDESIEDSECVVTSLNLKDRDNNYVFTKEEQDTVCREWKKLSKEHYGNDEKFDAEYVIYINDEQFSMVCEQIVVKYNGKYILLNNNINEVIKRVCYAGIIE